MADVTVKRLDEFEAIFGGGFRRVRAGLGVTSFGVAVMEIPPNFKHVPRARPEPRRPGGGLHGALGQGDASSSAARRSSSRPTSGSGSVPTRSGRSSPATSPVKVLAIGGTPGRGLRPTRVQRRGRLQPLPEGKAPLEPRLAEEVLVRRPLLGLRAGSVLRGHEVVEAGDHRSRYPRVLVPNQVGGARGLVGDRDRGGRQLAPVTVACARANRRSRRSPRIRWRRRPGRASRGARSCRRPRRPARRRPPRGSRPGCCRAEASASTGSSATMPSPPGRFDESIPAFAQIQPSFVSAISTPGTARRIERDSASTSSTRAGSLPVRSGELSRAIRGIDLGKPAQPALGLRDHLLRDDDDLAVRGLGGRGDQRPEVVALPDLGQAGESGAAAPRARRARRARRASQAAAVSARAPSSHRTFAVRGAGEGSSRRASRRTTRSSAVSRSRAREPIRSSEKAILAARARDTWRAQLSGPKAGAMALGRAQDQGVRPGAGGVGDDERGPGAPAEVPVELLGVEQRAVDREHGDAVRAGALGRAGPGLGRLHVPAVGFLAQHAVAHPAGVAGDRFVGGDDDRVVDRLRAAELVERVEEHRLGEAGALGRLQGVAEPRVRGSQALHGDYRCRLHGLAIIAARSRKTPVRGCVLPPASCPRRPPSAAAPRRSVTSSGGGSGSASSQSIPSRRPA